VQELIPGSQERVYSLFTYIGRGGVALASVVGRKLRQGPLRFGTSAVFLVDYDERVLELGLRLLSSAGYPGFAQVEFAHDARDDTFQLLEVNTRLPMWAGVAMSRYFDLARIAYDDLCGAGARAARSSATTSRGSTSRRTPGSRSSSCDAATSACATSSPRTSAARRCARTFTADDPLPALAAMSYLRSKLA
jgi:predicted ATP-grasp superfamily ATP-dependent carboligase